MKFLLRTLIIFITATSGLLSQPLTQKLDEYLASAHRMDQFNGVALVARKGTILLHKAYGLSNAARQTPNDTVTRFPILSITKTFTSTVILRLQEQGKLSVQDKLKIYLPDFPKGDSITIDHLLTHTSGLFDYMSLIDEEDSAIVCHPVAKQRVLDLIKDRPLAFKPGSTFAYCNSGYFLLGLVIEKVTGKPYEQVIREMIVQPLGMTHSGFDYLHLPTSIRAQGYDTLTTTYQSTYPHFDSTVAYSAGAMYSTSGDLYKWGRAVASRQLLSADSWKQAFRPRLNNYGYGWMVGSYLDRHYVGHDGGYPGFMSSFVYYPEEDITIILLKNSGHYSESLAPTTLALTAILLKKPYSLWQPRTEIKLSETVLQQYVGRYRLDPKVVPDRILTVSLENGKLFVQATDEPRIELFAQSENSFFLKAFNNQWTFRRDRKGQVNQAVIHVNGMDVLATRLPPTAQTQPGKTTAEKLDEYLTASANLHHFNGTVLIARHDTILLQKGYGWRNESARIHNDTSSIYQLGSITKTFVGAAVLQLQNEGKLSVKDKLSKFMPDYPNGDQITLTDLFAHTSGIHDYKSFLYAPDGPDKVDFTRPVSKEQLVSMFSRKPATKPGGEEKYTNSGYFLLGLVIEKVTGKPFETVIRERFIRPLQLTRTGFDFINLKQAGKTTGYTYEKDSVLVAVPPIDSTAGYAAGGMFSTVGDLYRWSRALQTQKIMPPETWKLALTPIGKTRWGYGWGTNTFRSPNDLAFQNGNLPGFGTYLMLFPIDGVTIIALANVDDGSDLTSLEPIVRDLIFITFGLPYQIPKNHRTIALSEPVLRQYIGDYQLDPKRTLSITFEKGRLFLQVTGQGKFEIYPESDTDFFLKAVDAQLTFHKNAAGQVYQVVVHQNGDTVANRL